VYGTLAGVTRTDGQQQPEVARMSGASAAAKATGIVAVGMMAMNVLAYAFSLLSARRLGPDNFGAMSALLGVLIVANVGALALQATAARRLATVTPGHRDAVSRDIIRNGWRVALGLGVALLLAAPLLSRFLHLDNLAVACSPAAAMVPLTLMGAYGGVLQGERRWTSLAVVYATMGGGRIVAGGGALLIEPSLGSAMLGITIGAVVPAVVGAGYCRAMTLDQPTPADHEPVLRELWTNGHALLAFFAFTNLDVLLARHLFDDSDAGVYAAGAILAKACLFLPTFVLVVAFPTMAAQRHGRPWRLPLLAVAGLGLVAVAGAAVLPDLAVQFAGGREYADLAKVAWLFALEGTVFACLQILVYDSIAGQQHASLLLWVGGLTVLGAGLLTVDSVLALVACAAAVGLLMCLGRVIQLGIDQRSRDPQASQPDGRDTR